jgi:hypothetical protein
MGNVEFLASCGCMPLITLNGRISEKNGRMIICNLRDFVRSVLSTTKLLINPKSPRGIFEERLTVSDAIGALEAN